MKILLFGKNGQIGKEIDRLARQGGFDIISYGRQELDIIDTELVTQTIRKYKPHIIINATAFHVVPECEAKPELAFLINAASLKPIADLCNELAIQFLHISSDYVFDGTKGKQYQEDDRPNPLQIYGISKLAGEQIVLQYCKKGVIIRTSGVYGGKEGSRSKKGNFVLTMLKQTKGKKELEVSSEQIISPSYAVDIASAILSLLKKKNISGIYHLVNEGYCSWAEFAKEIMKVIKRETKIIPLDRGGMAGALRRPLFSALINTRSKKLDIVLPTWQDGVKRYLENIWIKNQKSQ